MHQHIITMIDNSVYYVIDGRENIGSQVHILGVLDGHQVFLGVVENFGLSKLIHLLHRISHGVNVIYVAELDVTVRVELRILNTATLDTVRMGRCPRPGIKDHQFVSRMIPISAAYF